MEYYIVSELFAVSMGRLTKTQFSRFFECCKKKSVKVESKNKKMHENQQRIYRVEYRDNWEPSKTERRLSFFKKIYSVFYIKIVPAAITKTKAPKEFKKKLTRFQEMKDLEFSSIPSPFRAGMKQIKVLLAEVEEIKRLYPSTPYSPRPTSIAARLKKLLNDHPETDTLSAAKIARVLGCSKSAIIGTEEWKRIMAGRRPSGRFESWADMSQVPDNRSENDRIDHF